ncbi:30S ribosomal protein S4 [Clostridium sp. CAG:433]|jgi:small subunit ribosomal protein S4|nr:30S ribosomal protein S4 [Bacilli bacterium]CDD30080.1 30S ribosomal protein S4 [Clostridium sp. CAG:433]HCJ31922.1 30S ribosomal protein S4 [Bacillota bacterium]
MSRYTGPANKKSRRVGFSTLENGKDLAKRPYKPGQHGQDRKAKASNYSIQLNEKQKVKFTYGLNEKQFRLLFNKAGKMQGIHGENFLRLLESRLDNIVYRMGLSRTRRGARQIVNHGHILVNGKKVDIPSYMVKPGDVISVKESSKDHKAIKEALEAINNTVEFVTFDKNKLEGTYVRLPERSELSSDINEALIVEFYSR